MVSKLHVLNFPRLREGEILAESPLTKPSLYFRMVDWAQREGYLELRRREAEGLPLIDPNLVSVDKFELPEDEELGDTEIII